MSKLNSFEKNKDLALLESIEKYLHDNLHSSVTLDELCQQFCISRSSLCRKWKEYSGNGVIEYFLRLKIKEAQRLLEEGALSITQIAERLNYTGIHHFSFTFKKATGLTPSKYREKLNFTANKPAGGKK